MPYARPERPAWSEPSPRPRGSTSSRLPDELRVELGRVAWRDSEVRLADRQLCHRDRRVGSRSEVRSEPRAGALGEVDGRLVEALGIALDMEVEHRDLRRVGNDRDIV